MNLTNNNKNCMLSQQVYLDNHNQTYKNIIVINLPPDGPLGQRVRRIQTPVLSTFQALYESKRCALALVGDNNCLLEDRDIPDLFSFLLSNGYTINTSLTKMMNGSEIRFSDNKILCFITYVGP